jgi:hypothetical protein
LRRSRQTGRVRSKQPTLSLLLTELCVAAVI